MEVALGIVNPRLEYLKDRHTLSDIPSLHPSSASKVTKHTSKLKPRTAPKRPFKKQTLKTCKNMNLPALETAILLFSKTKHETLCQSTCPDRLTIISAYRPHHQSRANNDHTEVALARALGCTTCAQAWTLYCAWQQVRLTPDTKKGQD